MIYLFLFFLFLVLWPVAIAIYDYSQCLDAPIGAWMYEHRGLMWTSYIVGAGGVFTTWGWIVRTILND
jgi:hypothetical protein